VVAAHGGQRLDHHGRHSQLVVRHLDHRRRLADEIGHVDLAERVGERARLDARGVEDVADHRGEPSGLLLDQREKGLALLRGELPPAGPERGGAPDDRRHRGAQLVGDERDEVGAQRGEPPQLLGRVPLRREHADVLDGRRELSREKSRQLDLVFAEGVRRFPRDRQHAEDRASNRQGRDDARLQADGPELALLRIPRALPHVPANDGLAVRENVLQDRARDGARRPGGKELLVVATGVCHHEGVVPLREDDREPVEVENARHLREEAAQGLLLVERRREGPADSIDGFELIGAAPEPVA
jgi:hypothetical protein